MKDTEIFLLAEPIKASLKVDGKNDIVDLETLYLSGPTYKHKDKTLPLKQAFISAQMKFGLMMKDSIDAGEAEKRREEREGEEDSGMDASAIKMILFGSGDSSINLPLFFKNFIRLLESVAFKDEKMTQPIKGIELEKLSEFDFDELVAKYIEVFFISSWMKTIS
tara:strand:+ start:83 stop:577 length:495 start_codon:yes stop_codon:yes gene_type:complete